MTTTGPIYGGTAQNTTGIGTIAWSIGDLTANDANRCVAALTANATSNYLEIPFDFSAIGDTDTIDAILVEVWRSASTANRVEEIVFRWKIAGTLSGTDKSTATRWPSSNTQANYGNTTSDNWGLSITGADLKAANTYLAIVADNTGTGSPSAYIDSIRVTVVHTAAASGVDITVSQATIELVEQAVTVDLGTPPGVDITVSQATIELVEQAVTVDLGTPPGVTITVSQATIELVEQAVTVDLGEPPAGVAVAVNQAVIELVPASGITIQAPGAALLIGVPTPLPISVNSLDYVDHTARTISHSVEASSNPLATESLLKSNASGYLRLVRLGLGMDPTHPLDVAGNIRLSGDLLHSADLDIEATGGDVNLVNTDIQAHNWTSGTTGWGISHGGDADFRNITADTLTVEAFIADVNLALAGSQLITKSLAILAQAFAIPSTTGFLYVYDLPGFPNTAVFENGDIIRLRYVQSGTGLVVGDAWGTVASYTDQADGSQRWTFTRTSGTVGQVVTEGMVVLDYGASGDGYVHTTTLDSAGSPYTEIGTWVTDPSSGANHTIHVRLGNLDGIAGVGAEYGLWAGQSGEAFLLLSDTNFEAHGLALSLYDDDGEAIRLDPAGPYLAIGYPLPSGMSSGGAGLWVGLDGSDYMLRLGEASGVGLRWDGNDLTLRNAADAAVITLDASGNSYFAGPMTLGASGGIYQGTGTFTSPTTGLKLWRSGSYGQLGVYQSGALQVSLNEDGLDIQSHLSDSSPGAYNTVSWSNAGGLFDARIWGYNTPQVTGLLQEIKGRSANQGASWIVRAEDNDNSQSVLMAAYAASAVGDSQFNITIDGTTRLAMTPAYARFSGDVRVGGTLKSYKNFTEYNVSAMTYLTTALTSTSWDGDNKTTGNNAIIDLSAVFGVPAGVKAILARVTINDASVGAVVTMGPDSTNRTALSLRVIVASQGISSTAVIPCDSNGDVYFWCNQTIDEVTIEIWGYAI